MNNLNGKNLCNPHGFMRHKKLPTNTVTHPGIMAIKPNVVWVGCPDPDCKKEVAIKKCNPHEAHVQKVLGSEFPSFIPKVYNTVECFDGFYMYYEYMPSGTLKEQKSNPKIDSYVYKTLFELKKIYDKHPSFRHNDLHVDNVLVKGDTPLVYDFGFANWYGNPLFDAKLKSDYGIYPGNNKMYDVHFFINSISHDLPKRFKEKSLLIFPKDYITKDSKYVKNFRLRSDVIHKHLPTFEQVLQIFSVRNNKMARTKVRYMNLSGGVEKKTVSKRSPPKKPTVKFTLANKRRVSNRKAALITAYRKTLTGNNNKINEAVRNYNITAELQAIKNIEALKTAGLLTPSPSPVKAVKARGFGGGAAAGPSRPAPVVVFTNSPRRRPRINKKLCSSYKKDELMNVMRRLGHRVDKSMSLKNMCGKLTRPVSIHKVYVRPPGNVVVNVRKTTYPKYLKANLYKLGKTIGIDVKTKNKKTNIVNKLYAKLNANIKSALKKSGKNVTARQIAEMLAKNHGWKNNRHVERVRILPLYKKM